MTKSARTQRPFRRRIARRWESLEDRRVLAAVNFIPQTPVIAPDHAYATSAVPADIDNDGDLDLVTSSALDHRVGWYENTDGLGSFSPLRLISNEAEESRMVRTADLDGDGDLDVISANYQSNTVKWFENLDGLGEFGPARLITEFAIDATAVDTADIDGDGDLDLISTSAGDYDSDVSWYRNDGSGNFGNQTIITADVLRPYSAVVADVDGDGDPDVLSASLGDDKLAWYENTDGQGTFGPQRIVSDTFTEPNEIIAADIDGDGDLDVVAGQYTDFSPNDRVSWFANDGQGNFGDEQLVSNLTIGIESLDAVDVDGDGDRDLISASFLNSDSIADKVAWYENLDGMGRFGSQQLITDDVSGATSAIAGDLDGDGDLDVALSSFFNHTISWVKNDGNGGFSNPIVLSQFGLDGVEEVRAADVDGDGDLDVLSASTDDNTFAWYENVNGLGSFGPLQAIDTNALFATNIEAADLDLDGDLDVLGASPGDGTVGWYENIDGQGNFAARIAIVENVFSEVAKAVDVDGDLDLDVVVASYDPVSSAMAWFENEGNGQFGIAQPIWDSFDSDDPFDRPRDLEIADVDNDGDADLVVATIFDDTISWFENTDGMGTFGPQQIVSVAEGLWAIDVDDLDNNGLPDILVLRIGDGRLDTDDVVSWHANTEGGGFSPESIISVGVQEFPEDMDSADLDGDGDLDVVVGSFADDTFAWYENLDGEGTFGEEQVIDDDAPRASAVVAADLDNDGRVDVLTAARLAGRVDWYRNDSEQPVRGDFNGDDEVTAADLDLLCPQIASGDHLAAFDLTSDGLVDGLDLDEMITGILGTTFGDANLDGTFNSSDLVNVFRAGKYEHNIEGATWAEGDWNCDGAFDTSDLVTAFSAGGYSSAVRGVDPADLASAVDWMFQGDMRKPAWFK